MQTNLPSIESTFKPVVWLVLELYDQVLTSGKYGNIYDSLTALCEKMIRGSDMHSCFVISAQGIKIESIEWTPINLKLPVRENSYESLDLLHFYSDDTADGIPVVLSYNYTLRSNIDELIAEIDTSFFSFSYGEHVILSSEFDLCEEKLKFLKAKQKLEERIRKQRGDESENDINLN